MTIKRRLEVIERTISEYAPPCTVWFHSDVRLDGITGSFDCRKHPTMEECLRCQTVPNETKFVVKVNKPRRVNRLSPLGLNAVWRGHIEAVPEMLSYDL